MSNFAPKILGVAQLNEKGQFVIPKEARDAVGLEPGDRIIVALPPFANALVLAKPEEIEAHMQRMMQQMKEMKNDE